MHGAFWWVLISVVGLAMLLGAILRHTWVIRDGDPPTWTPLFSARSTAVVGLVGGALMIGSGSGAGPASGSVWATVILFAAELVLLAATAFSAQAWLRARYVRRAVDRSADEASPPTSTPSPAALSPDPPAPTR